MRDRKPKSKTPVLGIKDTKNYGPRLKKIAAAEERSVSFIIRRALDREISENGK